MRVGVSCEASDSVAKVNVTFDWFGLQEPLCWPLHYQLVLNVWNGRPNWSVLETLSRSTIFARTCSHSWSLMDGFGSTLLLLLSPSSTYSKCTRERMRKNVWEKEKDRILMTMCMASSVAKGLRSHTMNALLCAHWSKTIKTVEWRQTFRRWKHDGEWFRTEHNTPNGSSEGEGNKAHWWRNSNYWLTVMSCFVGHHSHYRLVAHSRLLVSIFFSLSLYHAPVSSVDTRRKRRKKQGKTTARHRMNQPTNKRMNERKKPTSKLTKPTSHSVSQWA